VTLWVRLPPRLLRRETEGSRIRLAGPLC